MARVQWSQRIQLISTITTLFALLLLGIFAYALGRGLTFSGALDYLATLTTNFDLVSDATDEFILAWLDLLPWTELIAVVLCVVGVGVTSYLLPRFLDKYARQPRVS